MNYQETLQKINAMRKSRGLSLLSHQDLIVQGFIWAIQRGDGDIIKKIHGLIAANTSEFLATWCLNSTIVPPVMPNQVVLVHNSVHQQTFNNFTREQFGPTEGPVVQYVNMHFPFKFFLLLKSGPTALFDKLKIGTKPRVSIDGAEQTLYVFSGIVCKNYEAYVKKIQKKYTFVIPGDVKCIKLPFISTLPDNYLDYVVSIT